MPRTDDLTPDPSLGPECSYGDFTYRYSGLPGVGGGRSRRPECCRPVEGPPERSHCRSCGGDYCPDHASPSNHDCDNIVAPAG